MSDIAFRSDGTLYGIVGAAGANEGALVIVDTSDASVTSVGIVADEFSGGGPRVVETFRGLYWNFHDAHELVLGPSWVRAQYDFDLLDHDAATVELETQQVCANPTGNQPRCTTSGRFFLTPSVHTRVLLDLTYDYRLIGEPTRTTIGIDIYDASSYPELELAFRETDHADTGFDPRIGTLRISDEMTMLPGITYWLYYVMISDGSSYVPSPNPATGSGVLNVEFRPFTLLPGDANCDSVVNGLDIAAFALLLDDPSVYPLRYPDCRTAADLNGDGVVDQLDVLPFVEAILRG